MNLYTSSENQKLKSNLGSLPDDVIPLASQQILHFLCLYLWDYTRNHIIARCALRSATLRDLADRAPNTRSRRGNLRTTREITQLIIAFLALRHRAAARVAVPRSAHRGSGARAGGARRLRLAPPNGEGVRLRHVA